MAGTNKLSVSFRVDDGVVEHNNRNFSPKNVDAARTKDNIIYKSENLQEIYHQLFDKALAEYNSKKRSNEKIHDYYEHIKNGKQEKPFYEVVVQFGDSLSCGLKSGNWETAKEMLDEYIKTFEQRNPNMKVFNAVLHLDEATPHLHIDFVPICTNQTRGLSTRVSLKRALAEQGITASSRKKSEWAVWKDSEFEYMTELLRKHGFERDVKNDTHQHLPVEEYKKAAVQKAEIAKINAHVNELKKQNATELTSEETALIVNQNDFLRSEIMKRDEKISLLSRKADAEFIPIEIYDDDKLQFVVDELQKRGIKFFEENTSLYVPDYALETAKSIAAAYKEDKPIGIREQIKLDIDTFVYSARDFEDLLEKLKSHGYEVKRGKFISVKPPFAKRFVRLKSLGDDYFPNKIVNRIMLQFAFANQLRERHEKYNIIGKPFNLTILHISQAITELRLKPVKDDKSKTYTFANDRNIRLLGMMLRVVSRYGFSSREQMCDKAEELQKIAATDEEKEELRKLRLTIKGYDEIVEGNYIDNRIKEQQAKEIAVEQENQAPQQTVKQHNHHNH